MRLPIALLAAFLLSTAGAAQAQAPKARDASKECAAKPAGEQAGCIKQVCSKAAKPANCEKNAHQQIEGPKRRAAAEAACKGKTHMEHTKCMSEHLKKK